MSTVVRTRNLFSGRFSEGTTMQDNLLRTRQLRLILAGVVLVLTGSWSFGAAGIPQQSDYVLGPGDQIVIRAVQIKEIADKQFRLEANGTVNLPMVGRVSLNGLS